MDEVWAAQWKRPIDTGDASSPAASVSQRPTSHGYGRPAGVGETAIFAKAGDTCWS